MTPAAPKPPTTHVARRPSRVSDREFLPAALEILETPPSPIRMALMTLISGFALSALVWSYVGRIDIIAVAQGKFQPTGRVKSIQSLDPGKVVGAFAQNGQRVAVGETLVALDPSEALADYTEADRSLAASRAEAARRRVAIDVAQAPDADAQAFNAQASTILWPSDTPGPLRAREERVIASDLSQLRSQIDSLSAQAALKAAEQARLTDMIGTQKSLLATLQERVAMRTALVERGSGPRASLIDAVETMQYQQTTLAQLQGQLAEAKVNVTLIAREKEKTRTAFVADNAQKLAEAERQADDVGQKLAKAQARLERTKLRSPIDGVVQASSLTTAGQVVSAGEEIMRVVPDAAALEIECYLPNKDAGFVKEGQDAIIKIESFPFALYGTLHARVTRVARDAVSDAEAQQAEQSNPRGSRAASAGGAQRTQNLVFPVTLAPDAASLMVEGAKMPLGPGMAVTAEIVTGRRRILEVVFEPLVRIASGALRER